MGSKFLPQIPFTQFLGYCLIGLGSEIDFAIVHPEFDPLHLPAPFKVDFYKSKGLYLSPNIEFADSFIPKSDVPFWLIKMSDLVFVKFEHIKLGNLFFLECLDLKHLVLIDVEFSNRKEVINQIAKLKILEFLVSDNVFSKAEMNLLKKKLPKLTFLSNALYNKKIEEDEIRYPHCFYEDQ